MGYLMSKEILNEENKLEKDYASLKVCCKCGHKQLIPIETNKALCDWCGRFVFRTKKDEFEYRTKEALNKLKKK